MNRDEFNEQFVPLAALSQRSQDIIAEASNLHFVAVREFPIITYKEVCVRFAIGDEDYIKFLKRAINQDLPEPSIMAQLCRFHQRSVKDALQTHEKPFVPGDRDRRAMVLFLKTSTELLAPKAQDVGSFSNTARCIQLMIDGMLKGFQNSSKRVPVDYTEVVKRHDELWARHEKEYDEKPN